MTKIFADGANVEQILELNRNQWIEGFTTNPTLMKKSGITNYEDFAKRILIQVFKPISFEVFADEQDEMYRQAKKIASWGDNVYVKIPIMNTQEISNVNLIRRLSKEGIKINATAITTVGQVLSVLDAFFPPTPAILSVFAGRIADTGIDPTITISHALNNKKSPKHEILWASCREVYNIVEAMRVDVDIITVPNDILFKYSTIYRKDLYDVSLDTVKMFYNDAKESGYVL